MLLLIWAFLSVTWNLMCRGINTETVKLSHLKAQGDCILFDFKVTKKTRKERKRRRSMYFVTQTTRQFAAL